MAEERKVAKPNFRSKNLIGEQSPPVESGNLTISFSKFNLDPVCLRGKFNNCFKDQEHFCAVATSILGKALPKVSSHKYSELCEGGTEGSGIHFHIIDKDHQRLVRDVLEAYGYKAFEIDQIFEGKDLIQFSGTLGHVYPTRVVCHKVRNTLYLLFLDTNHHIYMNEKYVEESLFYEDCPTYLEGKCHFMPSECFAFGNIDVAKLEESYGFTLSP